MLVRKIHTEDPEKEQWKMLLRFSYPETVQKYFDSQGVGDRNDSKLIENICGSISQAREYFEASKVTSLQIAPVLLYYGATNLLSAFASLKLGQDLGISGHGMSISDDNLDLTNLGEIKITPNNSNRGSLPILNKSYGSNVDICQNGSWRLVELFGSIPDLLDDFINYFPDEEPSIIPIEEVYTGQYYFDRIPSDFLAKFDNQENLFNRIANYNKAYLQPEIQSHYVILYRKLNYKDISIYSLMAEKFLVVTQNKQGSAIYLPIEISILMLLFCFGFICRYKANLWTPFIRNDSSGKRLLIDTFLDYVHRVIPNLALNYITNEKCIFMNQIVSSTDSSKDHSKKEIQELVRIEVNKIISQNRKWTQ
jgi:hypothetical protein